jgi:hypothetical protein
MNSDKKLYVYSGVAIATAIVAYFVITKKSKLISKSEVVEETVVTDTGSEIPLEQALLPTQLEPIFKLPLKEAVKIIGNKNIYTKVDNVMARKTPNVNNGIFNNTWGLISAKNTLVGRVTAIAEDKNGAKNSDGRVYKWLKVNLSANAKKSIDASEKESFLNRIGGALINYTIEAYVREDTITLI